jgi:hypothetical protein
MDPLSGLAVAAGVVQFIDFGMRLISATGQLYLSPTGRTAEEVSLTTIGLDLAQLSANVNSERARLAHGMPAEGSSEAILLAICEECAAAARELEDAIRELRPKDRSQPFVFTPDGMDDVDHSDPGKKSGKMAKVTHSFLTVVQTITSFDSRRWRARLTELRMRMMTASLAVLW